MHLVIVESPAKAKTIGKYLGKDYKVIASKGHVVDLPKSQLGINVDKDFAPEYVVTNAKSLKEIKQAFKKADKLVLAVDSDREGEAIGWHIAQQLGVIDKKGNKKKSTKDAERITFTEITKEAIQSALKQKHNININLVDAQQARRVLDRLVGYKLSPLLWTKIRYGLSAGRVQSVALRLIVDREDERDAFNPEEFWNVTAYLNEKKSISKPRELIVKIDEEVDLQQIIDIPFKLTKISNKKSEIGNEKLLKTTINGLLERKWIISDIETKNTKRNPRPPFITSTLQQTSANKFGYSAKQTMRLAQNLYEKGYITYMRTDSLTLSSKAVDQIRTFVGKRFGEDYMSEKARVYKSSSKNSQEAHEAIRPSDVKVLAEDINLDGKHQKLYRLIWERAVATQMKEALVETIKVNVEIDNLLFQATGSRLLYPGYLKVYSEKFAEVELPKLEKGQELFLSTLLSEQKFTEPPARFTEATLIKALEKNGIGRPSTYAPIISTISSRNYIEKEDRYLVPTDTGKVVIKLLSKHFQEIVDLDFTAKVEDKLDDVAAGKQDWVETIRDFYVPFAKNLEKKKDELKKEDFTVLGKSKEKCPVCGKNMVIKLSRYGKFYSCVDFPKCQGMKSMDEDELKKIDLNSEDFKSKYQPAPKTEDGRDYEFKKGRFGYFWAHPDYPKVKDAKPLELSKEFFKKVYGTTPKAKDGSKMILRRGRFGEFWAHPNYPEIKEVQRINAKELKEKKIELELLN